MPDVSAPDKPVAFGIRSPKRAFLAVWRIDGESVVRVRSTGAQAELLYPIDLGIKLEQASGEWIVTFPRPKMGCILSAAL